MGMVFRGRDPHIGRLVAIKLLRIGDEDLHDRFLREAQSAGGLKHPNIVTIYDFGEHEGAPFIVMEYVEGTTLAEHIKQNIPLTLVRKLALMEALAAGLEYAHNKGVVHRDVKPANVMVDREGILRILDFGIARVTDSGLTQTGMIMGTPNYMSPEQVEGKPSDRRSDIFSAGLVMYELLSYHQAFPGDTMHQVMNAIVRQTPVALRTLVPELDPALETIVNRAIEKDPSRRYQTMAAMGTHIARVRARLDPGASPALDDATVISSASHPVPARTDRHVLEQRRSERMQTLLKTAERALAAGRFVEALDACEQVVLISPDDAAASALMEQARTALDQQQVEQLVGEARGYLKEGELATAAELAHRALGIQPENQDANALLEEIAAIERETRERALKERAVAIAIERCRDAALAGDAEGVIAAADEVLALDREHAEARDLLTEARGLVEARERERDAERRAREAVERASQEFHDGRHDDSIARLEQYSPPHSIVTQALEDLRAERAEFERLKREAERQRKREAEEAAAEKQLQIALGLSRAAIALTEQRFAEASEIVDEVLALDPAHARALALGAEIEAAVEARQRQEEAERRADEAIKSAEALFDAGDHAAALELLTGHPGESSRIATALARLRQRQRTTSEREIEARRAEHDRRAAEAIAGAQQLIEAGRHREALEALEHFTPSHPEVDRVLRDLRRDVERRREAEWIAEQTAAAAAEIDGGRFEDGLARLNRLPQAAKDGRDVAALVARAESGVAAAMEAQRERNAATTQLADAEAAAEGWEPARTLAILKGLEPRVRARADLEDLAPRIEQLTAFARKRQDGLSLFRESTAQLRSGALQTALATIERAIAGEPQLPGAVELRERIQSAIQAEAQQRERDEAAQTAVGAARQLAHGGRLAEAIAALEQADAAHPLVARTLTDLRGQRTEAEHRDRERREQDEKRAQARRAEITGLLKRARKARSPEAAIALLRSALELDPDNAEAQDVLARAQEQREAELARAAGVSGPAPPRSRLWPIGGIAAALVLLVIVGYIVRNGLDRTTSLQTTSVTPVTVAPTTSLTPTTSVLPTAIEPTSIPTSSVGPGRGAERGSRGSLTSPAPPRGQISPPTTVQPTPTQPLTTTTVTPTPTTTTTVITTTTSVPATTTSVAPAAPAISESAARQVVEAYYAAYRARDFGALRRVFPNAPDLDRARIGALRKDFEPCDYGLRDWTIESVGDARALVRVDVTETCRPRIRVAARSINASRAFVLTRTADGRWIITNGP